MSDINYEKDLKIDKRNLQKELEYKESEIYYKYSKHYIEQVKLKEKAKATLDITKQKDDLEKKYALTQLLILELKNKGNYEYIPRMTKEILNSLVIKDVGYQDELKKYRERVKRATDEYIEAIANEKLAKKMLEKIFQRSKKIEMLIQMELKGL